MLRSRPNRQQRPSESSNERHSTQNNNNGNYHYGGYPSASSSSAGPMSISSGADDYYDDDDDKKKGKGGSNRGGMFNKGIFSGAQGGGFKYGGGGGQSSAAYSHFKKNRGHSAGGGGGGIGNAILLISISLLILLTGSTFYYRKMNGRANVELLALKQRARHPHEQRQYTNNNNNGDAETKANNDEINELKRQQSQLQGELSRATVQNKQIENDILSTTKITETLGREMTSHNTQYETLIRELDRMEGKVKEYRQQFIDSHPAVSGQKSGGDNNNGGIVPGGPGHTLNTVRELQSMESLEDYEDYVQRREDALWDKIDLLIEKIGRESKREALEWFGYELLRDGVPDNEIGFRVTLDIEYPKLPSKDDMPSAEEDEANNPEKWKRDRGTFTIEMAPLELMPIAVNLFLQQVHHRFWNGCSFVINAMHILQAGPHEYNGKGTYNANSVALKSRFEKSRLDKMPYQEYSHEYPHKRYTVGFAGRPGGPDFYINKVDNSVNHGPGGQSHHDLHEEADPCFGTVIDGLEILEDLNRIPVDRENGNLFMGPVTIVGGRVLPFRRQMNDGGGGGPGGGRGRDGPDGSGGRGGMPPSEARGRDSFELPSSK